MLALAIAALLTALGSCGLIPAVGLQQISPHAAPQSPALTTNQPPRPAYLIGEIPPCTPANGSTVDPCEPRIAPLTEITGMIDLPEEPPSVQYFLKGARDRVPHIVLRATYLPGTVRCATTVFRPRPYHGPEVYRFLRGSPMLMCYADVRVNAYILGSGPPTLTVKVTHDFYPETWEEEEIQEMIHLWEQELNEGGWGVEHHYETEAIPGREAIMFIGPAVGIAVEVWEVFGTWNIERRDDGTVIAVHPLRDYYSLEQHRDALEIELPSFRQQVIEAQAARVEANEGRILPEPGHPMLLTDVHYLRQFFTEVGAYGDITPDNGTDETFMPVMPPPVPPWTCPANLETDQAAQVLKQRSSK